MTKKEEPVEAELVTPPGRKVAIVGTAPSTRAMVWELEDDWEIWLQADYWDDVKRASRWFEFALMQDLEAKFPKYIEYLAAFEGPVYMRDKFEQVPTSLKFSFDVMAQKYGQEFMSSTVVWEMALACAEHEAGETVSTIALFGYDMALDGEYSHQRPGIRHMEWIARQLGIEVMIPRGSDLTITPIPYPFADSDPMVGKIRARKHDIKGRIAYCKQQVAELEAKALEGKMMIKYLEGALESDNYYERMACGVKDPAA